MFLTLIFTTNPVISNLIGEEVNYSSSHEGLIIYDKERKNELYRDEAKIKTAVTSAPYATDDVDFVTVSISQHYVYIFMNTSLEYLKNKEEKGAS